MTPLVVRLLSPKNRRIVHIDRSNPRHALLMSNLARLGWTQYAGPAQVDGRGWVIPGTDPGVLPLLPTTEGHRKGTE